MTDSSGQRPPYEDVEPLADRVDTRKTTKMPAVVDAPQPQRHLKRVTARPEPEPPLAQPWNEARIFRLIATLVGTGFVVGFVVTMSRALPLGWAWVPWLVGSVPYLAFAWMSWDKHLNDESASRERRERWQHSRLDVVALGDQPPDTERWK